MSRFRERHFYGNFRKHATPQNTDTYFAREHAVETHVKTWQGPLYANLQEKSRAQSENPGQEPAFTATVRTLQGGHTVWGKIKEQHQ